MLVLTRKVNESIAIGDNIKVQILKIDDKTVRIGIQADKEIAILRTELQNRKNSNHKLNEILDASL